MRLVHSSTTYKTGIKKGLKKKILRLLATRLGNIRNDKYGGMDIPLKSEDGYEAFHLTLSSGDVAEILGHLPAGLIVRHVNIKEFCSLLDALKEPAEDKVSSM